jgi:DNA-binding response OmpR family regulator
MRILLIQEDKLLRELLDRKLTNHSYRVDVACSGEDGLRAVRLNTPDLIILEIMMLGKNGFEIMQELKEDEDLKNIPVIIVSNSGQSEELNKAKEMGVAGWILKTDLNLSELIKEIKKIEESLFKN